LSRRALERPPVPEQSWKVVAPDGVEYVIEVRRGRPTTHDQIGRRVRELMRLIEAGELPTP
jgi:hypothetical protein